MEDTIVIALGGSLLSKPSPKEFISWKLELVEMCSSLAESRKKILIVVGGGKLARKNILIAKNNGVSDEFKLDLVGIEATRINANSIVEFFSDSKIHVSKEIPKEINEAILLLNNSNIVVMGGTVPGHTTDAVAIKMGKEIGTKRVIIATNVTHVYTNDPKLDANAKPIESMTLKELGKLTGIDGEFKPGSSFAVDPVGVKIAIESNISLAILDGDDINNLRKAICSDSFEGTLVEGVVE